MKNAVVKTCRTLGLVVLLAAGLGANAWAQASDERPVILAVGESTTAGFGVGRDESYPARLQVLLDEGGHEYRVVNHGRSGITTAMALSSLDRGLALRPEIVLIALGGNDQGNNVARERTKENLRKMVSLYVRSGAKVFLADRNIAADRAQSEEPSLFAELVQEEGATLMPSLRQDVAGRPELLLGDGSHPNADGYVIIADRLFAMLAPHLQQ